MGKAGLGRFDALLLSLGWEPGNISGSGRTVLVQTHDFPDIDAVASAWGLSELLRRRGFEAVCASRGPLRSRSLSRLVAELKLPLELSADSAVAEGEGLPESENTRSIIVVDGSPANGNVTLFPGKLAAIVDHHCVSAEPRAPFVDVRSELASCSAIIHEYWAESGEAIPRDVATALLAGIQSDSDFLSRRAAPADFTAYSALRSQGNFERASSIVRTVFDLRELELVIRALDGATIRKGFLWACLEGPCGQEVLAVSAEFVLRTEEIQAVVVAGHEPEGVYLSVRSKDSGISAFDLVRSALAGLGRSGGHSHSAGGFVPESTWPGEEALRERFFANFRSASQQGR